MGKYDKLKKDVMSGQCDHNIKFNDFCNLLDYLGFILARQKGSHIMYKHATGAFANVQKDGSKAKGYEVKQLRDMINKYGL